MIDTPTITGLEPGERCVERLHPDAHGTGRDRDDLLVVCELLAALLALFLVLRDEALDELDRMASDASRLLVDEPERDVRTVGCGYRDLDWPALLVDASRS